MCIQLSNDGSTLIASSLGTNLSCDILCQIYCGIVLEFSDRTGIRRNLFLGICKSLALARLKSDNEDIPSNCSKLKGFYTPGRLQCRNI